MMKRILALFLVCLTVGSNQGFSVPLETYQDFTTANPITSRRGQWTQLLGRGTGTNDFYVLEVDPITGALPVSGTFTATSTTSGPTGSAVPAEADYIAGIDGNGDLQGLSVTTGGVLNVQFTPVTVDFGVTTNAERIAAVVGNSTGELDYNAGNASAQTPRVVIATDQAAIPVTTTPSVVDYGVTTNAQRVAAQVGNATGAADFGAGAVSAQTQRVTIATDDVVDVQATDLDIRDLDATTDSVTSRLQDGSGNAITSTTGALDVNVANTSISVTASDLDIRDLSSTTDSVSIGGSLPAGTNNIGDVDVASLPALPAGTNNIGDVDVTNFPATVSTNTGAADASTIRVVTASNSPAPAGRSYGDSARLDYSSSNVTTGAWVEIDASTAATFNALYLFSSCGEALELGTGAASSETRVLLIPPGGLDGAVPLAIPSGTRLSVRGVSGSCTSGQLLLTGLN